VIQKAEEVDEGFSRPEAFKKQIYEYRILIEIFGQLFIEAMYGICLKKIKFGGMRKATQGLIGDMTSQHFAP